VAEIGAEISASEYAIDDWLSRFRWVPVSPDAIYYQLAENYYHKTRRRSETRVIDTFGRADQVDPEALRRLAHSLLRVANDERIDLAARTFPPDVGIDDIEQV